MEKKPIIHTETAYLVGLFILAFGNGLMTKADLGLSMVIAPAYILHLKISETFSWFTFGVAEYSLQAVLLVITALALRRFKPMYLFSFITAVLYGNVLDLILFMLRGIPVSDNMLIRLFFFSFGKIIACAGLAFLFRTYIAPEAYELLVKEVTQKFKLNLTKVKTSYDISSLIAAIALSFLFFGFGHFEGVKFGTVVCALVNGLIIGFFAKLYDKHFCFKDAFPRFKRFFEE